MADLEKNVETEAVQENVPEPISAESVSKKEEKHRQLWLKDKERRKGQPKKVKIGLRRKLFMMIVSLIAGLLLSVSLITLRDEEIVLRRELKNRGGTVARNLADSIYNSYANLIQEKSSKPFDRFIFDPSKPNTQGPLQFSDAMTKASEQQDFITGYAIDPQNRVFVESGKKAYLYSKKTPAAVFDFKAIYPIKRYLEKKIEDNKIATDSLADPETERQLLGQLVSLKDTLALLTIPAEQVQVSLLLTNSSIHLSIKKEEREQLFNLNLKKKELEKIGALAIRIIHDEATEFDLFLRNNITDFRKLRRTALLRRDKQLLRSVFSGLEKSVESSSLKKNRILSEIPALSKSISSIHETAIKRQAITTLASLKNSILRFQPIVQILTRKISEKTGEDVLYITYPMCETDKYFSTYRGEVHLILSQQGIIYTINYAAGKLQLAAALAIVIGTLFTIIMALFITEPIKKLMKAMRRVGSGDLNQTVYVQVSDEIGVLADNFNEMTEGLREKEKIRSAMNKALSRDIAEVMLSGDLKLGGDNKYVTVLFSDIRGFTTISEEHSAEEVVTILNEYLTIMTNIIEKHRGIVDKFVGDEIMAVWGTPKSYGNDALAAVKAALEMMEELNAFNEKGLAAGRRAIDIGIGLNTGEVIAANMGSENRMNYTIIGDSVNLGSRLEGTNKIYGTHVIISEFTEKELRGLIYKRELDLIRVKGKNRPVGIYEVMGLTPKGEEIRTTAANQGL